MSKGLWECVLSTSPSTLLALAAVLRVVLIGVAELQDYLAEVAYTDIDYRVFSEAAESVHLGLSPYAGRTELLNADATRYRYTPLLAYLLLPCVWIKAWGKLLFSILDLVAGLVLKRWLEEHCGTEHPTVRLGLILWLFNPFCFVVSTRGSSESIVVLLVYSLFYVLFVREDVPTAALLFGLVVHWRVYPIVYALPLLLALAEPGSGPLRRLLHKTGAVFGFISFSVFAGLTALFLSLYGYEFLDAAYLHHGRRRDPQHNFSVYFYPTALHLEGAFGGIVPDVARFAALPQIAACAVIGWKASHWGPAVATLAQTVVFVALNKVITAQYFVWWWSLLPLALPWLSWKRRSLAFAVLLWVLAEVHWLLWAYFLEFRQWPVRPVVWCGSCIFLWAHLNLLLEIWRSAREGGVKAD